MMKSYLFNNYTKRYFSNYHLNNKLKNMSQDDASTIVSTTFLAGIFGSSIYLDSKSKYSENDKVLRGMSGLITTLCLSGAIYRIIKILK